MSARDPRLEPYNEPYTENTIPMRRPADVPPSPRRQPPSRTHLPPQGLPAQQPAAPRSVRRSGPRVPPPLAPAGSRRSPRRWLRRGLLLLVPALLLACVGMVVFQQQIANKVKLSDVRQNRPPANLLTSPMNILLLGVDLREGFPDEGVRSDSLIVLHLDPAGGWGSLISIPRDTLVEVPGFEQMKINAAFARGYENVADLYGAETDPSAAGAALAADTVERFLDLPVHNSRINYVATINFNGFAKLIDAVGGIEVDVPREIVDTEYPTADFGYMTLRIPAGRQRMNGETALQYVRTRHADSDFGRAQRQQQVIRAIVQALREQPAPLRPLAAMRVVNAASDATRTTMPVGRPDALLMAAMLSRIDPSRIAQYRIDPERVGLQEYGSDLVWNSTDLYALVAEALTPPGEAKEQAVIQVQNGVGIAGVAGQLTDVLEEQRFTTATPDDAALVETSQIIDYGEHPATRERLSKVLGGMPIVEGSTTDAPPNVDIVVRLGSDYTEYVSER